MYIRSLETGEERHLVGGDKGVFAGSWSPDGSALVADVPTPIARPGGTASVVGFGDQSTRVVSEASLGGESSPATTFLDRKRGASRRSLRGIRLALHARFGRFRALGRTLWDGTAIGAFPAGAGRARARDNAQTGARRPRRHRRVRWSLRLQTGNPAGRRSGGLRGPGQGDHEPRRKRATGEHPPVTRMFGSGGGIRTPDLRVMSETMGPPILRKRRRIR